MLGGGNGGFTPQHTQEQKTSQGGNLLDNLMDVFGGGSIAQTVMSTPSAMPSTSNALEDIFGGGSTSVP